MMYRKFFKRLIDIVLSLTVIVAALPVLVVCALLIKWTSKGGVLFLQDRVGLNGRKFSIYKLRTMKTGNTSLGRQTRLGDSDVTYVGNVLRRLKLDELPQVVNVLLGDMSLVGPRPCLVQSIDSMPEWAKARFSVRPGMTGLAQINGNAAISWERRWRFDAAYAANCSFLVDLSIMLKTFAVVAFGEERFGVAK
jgi:undecaprenyl phosphate N,N'-diacetylbacillosamine 1-phosphate transferase